MAHQLASPVATANVVVVVVVVSAYCKADLGWTKLNLIFEILAISEW